MAINRDKLRATAQRFIDKDQLQRAIDTLLRLLKDDPSDVRTRLKIGDLFIRQGNQSEATRAYAEAAEYYQAEGFYLKAVAVYKQLIKLDPACTAFNLRLAELYHELGLPADAMAQYAVVYAAYEGTGQKPLAQATLEAMLKVEPNDIATRLKLAELYVAQQQMTRAHAAFTLSAGKLLLAGQTRAYIEVLERVSALNPNDLETTQQLAHAHLKGGDAQTALAKLQSCLAANGKNVTTLRLYVQALRQVGRAAEAIAPLQALIALHGAAGQIAQRDAAQKNLDQLQAPMQSAAARRPPPLPVAAPMHFAAAPPQVIIPPAEQAAAATRLDAETFGHATGLPDLAADLEEVHFFLQQGLHDDAHQLLESLVGLYPQHPGVLHAKSLLASRTASTPPSPKIADQSSVSGQAQLTAADAGAQDVSLDELFAHLQTGGTTATSGEQYDTHYNLGIAYKGMGLLEDAIEAFEMAGSSATLQVGASMMAGVCLLQGGRTEAALGRFAQALAVPQITPREQVALRYEIGRVYEELGRFADAKKFYEKAYAMDPTFGDVAVRLQKAVAQHKRSGASVSTELDLLLDEARDPDGLLQRQ